MWRWLHKNALILDLRARISIAVSCALHLLLLIVCLMVHIMQPVRHIVIHKDAIPHQNITIIIDPYAAPPGTVIHSAIDKKTAPQLNTELRSDALNAPVTIATTQKKSEFKTTPAASVKKRASKTKKAPPLSVKKKVAPKKTAVKQKEKKVPKAVTKEVPKKIKAPSVPEKPEVKKVTPPTPVCEEPSPQLMPVVESLASARAEAPINPTIEGPILIARSASHAAALTVQLAIQEELLRVWHPPVGIPEGIACLFQIVLDAQGAVHTLEIKKSSGIFLFDVSARAAIQQAVWPATVWGTTLELCLQ